MNALSKSKLIAWRQCAKRLWLEVHRPDLRVESRGTQVTFAVGHSVGAIARRTYDPAGTGAELTLGELGMAGLLARTQTLLQRRRPIFEAGFSAEGALALADVLLPVKLGRRNAWRMVEVKSSGRLQDYHLDDAAIQHHVATESGVLLATVSIAHVDTTWAYPGKHRYQGLLKEVDVTEEVAGRKDEVRDWVAQAQSVVAQRKAPPIATGAQCSRPFACGFVEYCRSAEPDVEHPVRWLPRVQTGALRAHLADPKIVSLGQVPDALLDVRQLRVKTASLTGKPFFDRRGAAAALSSRKLPAHFLDFETIGPAVPLWEGTRPYQPIPFQFSVHRLSRTGSLTHTGFLDLSGNDPTQDIAESLVGACGASGPVYVYYAAFEGARIDYLASYSPRWSAALLALKRRLVDLKPIVDAHYYHPSQEGSWSIKAVLPAMVPGLVYEKLDGVQDGGGAQLAYLEAISPETTAARKQVLQKQLLAYCRLDTYAMVRVWQVLSGRKDLNLRRDC